MTPRLTHCPAGRAGFTLFEVVLAIGLSAMVVYLLTTAMELYLVNVDASRGRVESAQLARTLLDQMAADLLAARGAPPPAAGSGAGMGQSQAPGATGGATGGASGPAGDGGGFATSGSAPSGGAPPGGAGGGPAANTMAPAAAGGMFGNATQFRVDRAAYAQWDRAVRDLDPREQTSAADVPMTVRYFFVDADRVTAAQLAQRGVAREAVAALSEGLYRETLPTAAVDPAQPPLPNERNVSPWAQVELLAPEVVALELFYDNGVELLEQWDPMIDGPLPAGMEIRLTLAEPAFNPRRAAEEQRRLDEGRYLESELVEYRRYVRLGKLEPPPQASPLLPAAEQGGAMQPGGRPGGAGGQRGPGGASAGGGPPAGGGP
ncbi:MAG TPA: hypothetical protein PJ982_02965 [Lacipirellulaceae bacterium]|nr:hypothetical protein [Lacipirellulaceae bacterium]